jgi:hypothetical protein
MVLAYLPYTFGLLIEIVLAVIIAVGWWTLYNRRIRQAGPIWLLFGAVLQFLAVLGHLVQYVAIMVGAYRADWYKSFLMWSSGVLWGVAILASIFSLIGASLVVFQTKGRLWERGLGSG